MSWIRSAYISASSRSHAASSLAHSADAARMAALSASKAVSPDLDPATALSAVQSAILSARSAAHSAARSEHANARKVAVDTSHYAVTNDAADENIMNFSNCLWSSFDVPEAIARNHNAFLDVLHQRRNIWGF